MNTIQFREQAHSNLITFQETSMMEKKQRERRMYMSVYKLKGDLDRSEFLQKKRKPFTIIAIKINL